MNYYQVLPVNQLRFQLANTLKHAREMKRHNIPMHTSNDGVDIGVDTSPAQHRGTRKQKRRIDSTKKRATRAGVLSRRSAKARRIAPIGVHTMHSYGFTAVGMAPSRPLDLMGAWACATTIIKWTFSKGRFVSSSADPRVTLPL